MSQLDRGSVADHQYAAQGLVTGPSDRTEPGLADGQTFFWRQSDSSGVPMPRFEQFGRRGFHLQKRRADRADVGDLDESLAALVGLLPSRQLGTDLVDLRL